MRLVATQRTASLDDNLAGMDWTAIGMLVRQKTLEEVSAHFHSLSVLQQHPSRLNSACEQDGAES